MAHKQQPGIPTLPVARFAEAKVSQPLTWCCDSRLRWCGQRAWNARARGWFQRVV